MHNEFRRTHGRAARAALILSALSVAACSDGIAPATEAPLPYITVRRHWHPGERDSTIARIQSTHALSLPYVGDVSDFAPALFADTDSVVVIIQNPAFQSSLLGGPFAAPG